MIEKITFADILPVWRDYLWPERQSDIDPTSAMSFLGGYDLVNMDSEPTFFAYFVDGEIAGMAIWFLNYSTWQGKHGIYLEDLFIKPEFRGRGFGKALLQHLAKVCDERGYGRFQWWVLDWNEPSINFYKSIGAKAMDEWTVYRVSEQALTDLARP